jgi:hypothetical protein
VKAKRRNHFSPFRVDEQDKTQALTSSAGKKEEKRSGSHIVSRNAFEEILKLLS